MKGSWDLGLVPCLLWTGSDVFLSTTSILHLTAIAIHRYRGIANPLRNRSFQDERYVVTLLAPAWTISWAISMPLVIQGALDRKHVMMEVPGVPGAWQCGIFDRTFAIYSSLVSFFVPLTLKVFADLRSVCILRQNAHLQRACGSQHRVESTQQQATGCSTAGARESTIGELLQLPSGLTTANESDNQSSAARHAMTPEPSRMNRHATSATAAADGLLVDETPQSREQTDSDRTAAAFELTRPPHSRHGSRRYAGVRARRIMTNMKKTAGRERRAEKTLIWVFVCFVVFWMPFFSTNFLFGVCAACATPDNVFLAFSWLGYASSGVNPCIYTLLNRDFRRAFRNIITCRIYRGDRNGLQRKIELDST